MQTEFYDQAVPRGADLLDQKIPGWYHRIDLTRLNIEEIPDCVFGQLAGVERQAANPQKLAPGFWEKGHELADTLGINLYDREYGFSHHWTDMFENNPYPYLTDLWRDEIQQRRLRDARAKTTHETLIAVTGG